MTPQQSDWKWFLGMNHTVKLESIGRTSWYLTHWTTSAEQNFLCNFPLTLIFIFLSEPLTYFTGVLYGVWPPEYLYPDPAPADLTDICIWKKLILGWELDLCSRSYPNTFHARQTQTSYWLDGSQRLTPCFFFLSFFPSCIGISNKY